MSKISVIIPVYNVEKYLRKCLDSVIGQTLEDIEIICVNDGSTDGSPDILKEYEEKDSRIKIINKQNGGLSSARNEGLKLANSEYVGFVDSDDWIEPETYEVAYKIMKEFDVDMVNWGANIISEYDNYNSQIVINAKKYHEIKITGLYDWSYELFSKSTVTVWNKLFKLSTIKNNDILFPNGLCHEDEEFTAKYLLHTRKTYYIDEYYYNYLQRKNSIMERQLCGDNYKFDLIDIYKNIYSYYRKHNALNTSREFLNVLFERTVWHTYNRPKNKKIAIKKIKELGKYLDNTILNDNILALIQKNKMHKISYIKDIKSRKTIVLSCIQKIFSIKNSGIHKIITILGLKLKLKSKRLKQRHDQKLFEQKVDRLISKIDYVSRVLTKIAGEYND